MPYRYLIELRHGDEVYTGLNLELFCLELTLHRKLETPKVHE
jgi:hypothetical protein